MKHVVWFLTPLTYGALVINHPTYHQCLETVGHFGLSMNQDHSFPVRTNNLNVSSWDQKIDPTLQVGEMRMTHEEELFCNELFNDDYWKENNPPTPITTTVDDSFCNCIVGPLYWDEHAGCSKCGNCGLTIWCPWSYN